MSFFRRRLERLGDAGMAARLCQNQDLQDWRDSQDFSFTSLLFAITGNPAKTKLNTNKRLHVKDAPEKS